jgi:hypothetical protein
MSRGQLELGRIGSRWNRLPTQLIADSLCLVKACGAEYRPVGKLGEQRTNRSKWRLDQSAAAARRIYQARTELIESTLPTGNQFPNWTPFFVATFLDTEAYGKRSHWVTAPTQANRPQLADRVDSAGNEIDQATGPRSSTGPGSDRRYLCWR